MPCCNESSCTSSAKQALDSPRWRRALWIALVINAGFFLAEIVAGAAAGSAALQADALDFLGDAANYAISLGVVGMALVWRSRAALLKGWPDVIVAAIMGCLGLSGGLSIVRQAQGELSHGGLASPVTAGAAS